MMRAALERHGYQVLEAENGLDAIRMWEKCDRAIPLLLTDMVLPEGMTGRDLAARLQAKNVNLKVIYTSGYSADLAAPGLDLQEGKNFLQKPCPLHQVLETVRRRLDNQ